jgi:large subunit ribosomal protein LP2
MRYVAAYLLAVLGGKTAPASGDIEKILSSVGIEVDTEKLKKVLSELNGKSIDDLLTQGTQTSKIPLFTVLRDDYTQHHLSYESV